VVEAARSSRVAPTSEKTLGNQGFFIYKAEREVDRFMSGGF